MVGRAPRRGAGRGGLAAAAVSRRRRRDRPRGWAGGRRWFTSLLLAYTLEGIGYIIAGTFLVAAIDQTASTALGGSVWIIVGWPPRRRPRFGPG